MHNSDCCDTNLDISYKYAKIEHAFLPKGKKTHLYEISLILRFMSQVQYTTHLEKMQEKTATMDSLVIYQYFA